MVPALDDEPWPTLGPQIIDWMEAFLVFGPGDIRGKPAKLDAEKRAFVTRSYEVYPKGHPQAGRRRFKRVAISIRKGLAKSEFLAWIAAVELHKDGPVRCDGFDASGNPVGRPVADPYIPLIAYTEEQSDELGYSALKCVLEEGPLARDFDIGLMRILRKDGKGRAVSLAGSPDARDGARTTAQWLDETHRMVLARQVQAFTTMLNNIPKRMGSDAWTLETTTAYSPGENSIAERTHEYAKLVAGGTVTDPRLFFFHRQAGDQHDLDTEEGARAAVLEASGPAAAWADILELRRAPDTDLSYWERVWCNRIIRQSDHAFDVKLWAQQATPDRYPDGRPPKGAWVVFGFDGSRSNDATALIGTEITTGYQWVEGLWERPAHAPEDWTVPVPEVTAVLEASFQRWQVWRVYCDPPYWETPISEWAGHWGDKVILEWPTYRQRPMAFALRGYIAAIAGGELTHSGDPRMARHIGNAVRRPLQLRDDDGRPFFLVSKERPDSPNKMDAAMGGCLSWECRTDALTAGVGLDDGVSKYETAGLLAL